MNPEEREEPMSNAYNLKLYNETLVTFSLEEKGLEGLCVQVLNIREDFKELLPLDLTPTNDGVLKWLQKRVLPKNRAFVDEILKSLGLSINNTKGIIDVCKGLSLNDSYWVVPQEFDGTFEEYNLYENRFSDVLSLGAYTGVNNSHRACTTSPELTTQGMLRKAWRFIEDDGIYLYKGGTEGAANAGNEPYSEYYAYQIAQTMGLNAVAYDLENWKGILASTCKLFTDIDTSFIPIGRIVKTGGLKACLDYYKRLGEDAYEELCSMLVFDAVIYNEDRHFGNFGILRDNHTGRIIKPAPIFDNGLSLFNYAMPEDFTNLSEYAKTRSTPYGVSFESICQEVIGRKQTAQLRKLLGFKFKRHPSINLPEERLQAIEKHIESRARELLSLPKKRTEKKPSQQNKPICTD
ncbi:MAG: XRE family transcriptional regulator [Clostridia bacterium]|nr:XRE family transcriptional regulator [Clostridia bacterium]